MAKPFPLIPDLNSIPSKIGERFFAKVDSSEEHPDPCHLWQGATNPAGFGVFWIDHGKLDEFPPTQKKRLHAAHRLAWMFRHGHFDPPGKDVYHSPFCQSRACVNPQHLHTSRPTPDTRHLYLTTHARHVIYSATTYGASPDALASDFGIPKQTMAQTVANVTREFERFEPYLVRYVARCLSSYRHNQPQPAISNDDYLPPNSDEITLADCL